MIKARGRTKDGPLIFLGLTRSNLAALAAGDPIKIDCAELGLHGVTILIAGGETRVAIIDEMANTGLVSLATAAALRATDDGEGN